MKLTLIVKSGKDSKRFELQQTLCVIGRKDADILLSDRSCSRNHAVLYESNTGDLRVKDLNSSNGTVMNGEKITDVHLDVGDKFLIGECEIQVDEFVPNTSQTYVGDVKDLLKKPVPFDAYKKGDAFPKKKAS